MLLFSGMFPFSCCTEDKDWWLITLFRTQESLDNGVKRMGEVYNSYNQVGIKDRSMIWNS